MEDMDDKIGDVPQVHLMNGDNNEQLSTIEKKITKLLNKVLNGMQTETADRKLTNICTAFGAGPFFNIILPLLKEDTMEDRQRYRLVKALHTVLHKVKVSVKPYVPSIFVAIQPLLISEDYYVRLEGRDLISYLSNAVELDCIIAALRPGIHDVNDNVRNTIARACSIVAYALGVPCLLPFLKTVCQCQESWQTRYTGIKIVHQITVLFGPSVLDDPGSLVEIIKHGLNDENSKVKIITALSLASLAKVTAPADIDSFNAVLKPLWVGITQESGKVLAAFLKAMGFIIPLMKALDASDYTNRVMPILIREFQSPDEELKTIILKVVKQCVSTDGVEADFIRNNVVPEFVENFWDTGTLDKRNYQLFVETTIEMANKVGLDNIANSIINNLTNNSEPRRQLAMKAIEKVVSHFKGCDIDVGVLIDGILYAFNEQTIDSDVVMMLNGFVTVVTSLGMRVKSHFPRICKTLNQRLNSQSVMVRKQSADLISRIAAVMKSCEMDQVLDDFCTLFFNMLQLESEEDLDSFLEAMNSIITVIGVTNMTLPMNDLVASLNNFLDNMSYKVKEVCINLLGKIAYGRGNYVSETNWMKTCFKICEKFIEPKKVIRTAAINTFGTMVKVNVVSPPKIIPILMDKLVATDRRVRIWSTVAIAIVAEVNSPDLVFYAMMNMYRVPDYAVQCRVVKSLALVFEYVGNLDKAYISAVTPLLEHALKDTNAVQRYLAVSAVKQMTLKAVGLGVDDFLIHLLNHVWPNILDIDSPIVMKVLMEAIDAMRKALGSQVILNYCVQGMFHPARRVREVYWLIYNSVYVGDQDALVPSYHHSLLVKRNS